MTTKSTSVVKEVLAAVLIAGFVATFASCTNVDNMYDESLIGSSVTTVVSVGNQTVTLDQYNSTFNFVVESDAQFQKDVKVSTSEQAVKSSVVEDGFRSVLSTVNINVKGEQLDGNGSTVYTINSIKVCGAYSEGQFNCNTNMMRVADSAQKSEFTLPVADVWKNRTINADDDFENASDFSFLMIPQNADNVTIVIEYQVEKDGYVIYRGTQEGTISGTWSQNRTYNYDIVLSNGASMISFDPTVD